MSSPKHVVVCRGFDDMKSPDLRFLEESAKLGDLTVLVSTDQMIQRLTGKAPKFPMAERLYYLNAVRFVGRVIPSDDQTAPDGLPEIPGLRPDIWTDIETTANPARAEFACKSNIIYRVFKKEELKGFPDFLPAPSASNAIKVVVTGTFDWLHSGHVRFLEEASHYGDLHVFVGQDANIRLLKGEGHPLLPEAERCYAVGSIKFVRQARIASGLGWLDAEPDIQNLKPDIYAVNEDGDKGGKRGYCEKHGIQYLVLKRVPAPGLPRRTSTDLRGF